MLTKDGADQEGPLRASPPTRGPAHLAQTHRPPGMALQETLGQPKKRQNHELLKFSNANGYLISSTINSSDNSDSKISQYIPYHQY